MRFFITQYKPFISVSDLLNWNFDVMTGRGVFIGDAFAVYYHMHKWYDEGDQKLWVDGQHFPADLAVTT